MPFDVVTIGSATVDHFADTDSELIKIDTRTSHEELIAFPLGSKLLIKELNTTTGGGGTNTAVAFSRLGLNTGFLGKIGADAAGDFVLEKLSRESVEFIGPRGGQTGFSVILNSIEDDRSILAYKGANDQLYKNEVPELDTQWLYISSMLEDSFDTVIDIVSHKHFNVAFNPSNYQAALGYEKLKPLIDNVTLLVMNREEACKLLGLDPNSPPEIPELMQAMAKLPCRYFVITDGSRGAWVYDREHCYHGTPTQDLKICETTGAGDAFAATFTAGIIRGLDIRAALNLAMTNSESVLQYKGAKEKLLTWDEISSIAANNERSIEAVSLASC
ncbi:carbohydrate kinase family protein [Hahella sp. CCB-MM4]|uniref:carbohydrate kinase family protein n=1 Tax=Hahella sp. (strain CCB-MM4) TaxID=1926491 RepID=UPI000B9AF326|nr:carbohydrate kinase family protein [Hahella sp. CCB-MM4]OZG75349.1 carbohydrate kinase family protein [Hahella sp. CCB-MM4]